MMSETEAVQIYLSLKQLLEVESDAFEKSELEELEKRYAFAENELKKFSFGEYTTAKSTLLISVIEKIIAELQPSSKGKITLNQEIDSPYGLILKITQDIDKVFLPTTSSAEISEYQRNENGIDSSEAVKVLKKELKNFQINPPFNFLLLIYIKEKILLTLLRTIIASQSSKRG